MSIIVQKSKFLMEKLQYWVVLTFFVFLLSLEAALFVPLVILLTPIFPGFVKWFIWAMVRGVLGRVIGLNVELEDAFKLESAPKGIIVMNHQSIWDFFMVCSVYHRLGDTVHTVSRKEVYYVWPLGYAMWVAGSIFIDRSSPTAALNLLTEESRRIFDPSNMNESKIIIFPEGTRNKKLDGFLDFKKGAFKVAASLNVPVIPIVCPPQTFRGHLKFFGSATVKLKCLDPVLMDSESDLVPQIQTIKSKMLAEYHKMMDEMGLKRLEN
uniref:1-acylglycerol-3-phosphate O-acyltransferase n=1 Tax=Lygus hesperus TaxID=30085 RepID=A0A0A9X835_LYGHE